MAKLFALQGNISGELISFGGKILVHPNRHELEFLFPKRDHLKIVEIEVVDGEMGGRKTMPLKDHPDMGFVKWPLERNRWVKLRR